MSHRGLAGVLACVEHLPTCQPVRTSATLAGGAVTEDRTHGDINAEATASGECNSHGGNADRQPFCF